MTGRYQDEDGNESFVIHWDGGTATADTPPETPAPAPEPAPPPEPKPPWHVRYRYWLYAALLFGLLGALGYAAGKATYQPASRLPTLVFETADPLYGVNSTVAIELDFVREMFSAPGALDIEPEGSVFELPLPRTVGDRLFGTRDESILVFNVRGGAGEHRFLVLEGGAERIFAIEGPMSLSSRERPYGVYVGLDRDDPTIGPLVGALEEVLPALEAQPTTRMSSDGLYVFGPYQGGEVDILRPHIEGNLVARHLAEAIEAANGSVSVAAPVLLLGTGPQRGTINAIYHPTRRLIMEPLWGTGTTDSLAHELVHAYIDTVIEDERTMLNEAADYLERAHPVLHGRVVGDLYERLGREGRAEESLAFIAGALASGQTKTVSTQRLLENTGNLAISEAILYSDIDLLVRFGILPECMLPAEGARGELAQTYYDALPGRCDGLR